MNPAGGGLAGAVFAVEGISDATAFLHGQNGCRRPLTETQRLFPRPEHLDSIDRPAYSGCCTVPFSKVDHTDYSGGSYFKLRNALESISLDGYGLVVIFTSSGLSIVGDDVQRAIGESGIGETAMIAGDATVQCGFTEGFDRMMSEILRRFDGPSQGIEEGTAVVVGLGISQKDWTSVREETGLMLESMGIGCSCFLGAGCSLDDIRRSMSAEYCIDLCPDMSTETRRFYEERGTQTVSIGCSPVGFDAVEELYGKIADATGKDAAGPMAAIGRYKKRAYRSMLAADRDMSGVPFCVDAMDSIARPLTSFLEDSFGMARSDDAYDVLFADGYRCRAESRTGMCRRCIDLGYPTDKVDFARGPIMGLDGTMHILDRLFG